MMQLKLSRFSGVSPKPQHRKPSFASSHQLALTAQAGLAVLSPPSSERACGCGGVAEACPGSGCGLWMAAAVARASPAFLALPHQQALAGAERAAWCTPLRARHMQLRHWRLGTAAASRRQRVAAASQVAATDEAGGDRGELPSLRMLPWLPPPPQLLSALNASTKWGATLTAAAIVALRPGLPAAWFVTGAVLNALLARALKRALNQPRPAAASSSGDAAGASQRTDPGMPSAHAQSLGFLSCYAARAAVSMSSTTGGVAAALLLIAAGVFLAWLRIATGLHTLDQVAFGFGVGSIGALAWSHSWTSLALRFSGPGSLLPAFVYCTGAASAVVFAVKILRLGERAESHAGI
eukprot:SM000051S17542  [mRNA]  locus=s51:284795:286504:+ [translate_table: standard]